jgi:hypothetical protein
MPRQTKARLMRLVREYGALCANIEWSGNYSTLEAFTKYKTERLKVYARIGEIADRLPPPPKPRKRT